MTLNTMLEQLCMTFLIGYGELNCRYMKKVSTLRKYIVVFGTHLICNSITAYIIMTIPPQYEILTKVIRIIGTVLIVCGWSAVFETGAWSSFLTMAIFDFVGGIPFILRYFIYMIAGLPFDDYTRGQFRILPLALFVLLVLVTSIPIVRFLRRYREALNYPGFLLKLLTVFYWTPTFLVVRPLNVMDLSGTTIMLVSSITGLTVVVLGWIYIVGYWRRIFEENHYLEMQTELIREHNQLLKDQKEVLRMCRIYSDRDCPEALEEAAAENAKEEYSSSEILNTAIENKIRKCKEQDLHPELKLEKIIVPKYMKEIEFLSIFYNLMDNAIEAALKCPQSRRYVRLKSCQTPEGLFLTVENSKTVEKNLTISGKLMTTKPDRKNHGYGLKIVRDMVRKSHGKMEIHNEKDSFSVSVFLPQIENE